MAGVRLLGAVPAYLVCVPGAAGPGGQRLSKAGQSGVSWEPKLLVAEGCRAVYRDKMDLSRAVRRQQGERGPYLVWVRRLSLGCQRGTGYRGGGAGAGGRARAWAAG